MRLLLLLMCLTIAVQAADDSNMACVERLEMPTYPPLANAAKVTGQVVALVTLSADGIRTLETKSGTGKAHPLLAPTIEKSMRASTFSKDCADKMVTVVFHFVQDERLPLPQTAFGYPNQFWIVGVPNLLYVSPTAR